MSLAQRIQAKLVGCQRQVQQPEDESDDADDEDEYDKSSEESCCNKTARDCRNLFLSASGPLAFVETAASA